MILKQPAVLEHRHIFTWARVISPGDSNSLSKCCLNKPNSNLWGQNGFTLMVPSRAWRSRLKKIFGAIAKILTERRRRLCREPNRK